MHIVRLTIWGALLAFAGSSSASAQNPAPACGSPEHRAFDFWVGEWKVYGADGKQVGTNRISRDTGDCVLHERYSTDRGYEGQSFNVYDASRKVWHQTWVDNGGLLLVLEGGIQGASMVLEGQSTGPNQQIVKQRITWTPKPDGSVRQLWESTDAKGEWSVAFDGNYIRQ